MNQVFRRHFACHSRHCNSTLLSLPVASSRRRPLTPTLKLIEHGNIQNKNIKINVIEYCRFSTSTINKPTGAGNNATGKAAAAVELDKLPLSNDDPDTFGTLSVGKTRVPVTDEIGLQASQEILELENEVESIYTTEEADDQIFKDDHPWTIDRLRRTVFELLRQDKLKEALDTYTVVVQDGGFPYSDNDLCFICSALISSCAKAGHVQMAFRLFNQMKKRGVKLRLGWYTSLFNACANSPWDAKENVTRIDKLRDHLVYKGIEPNEAHYHAMIKAYGRCGAIESAFSVVDDMRASESDQTIRISAQTFSFLLQACISDRENGFRHAVVTWEKMLKMKIRPDLYNYNLFLRAIRECSIQLTKSKEEKQHTQLKKPSTGLPEILQPFPGKLKENVQVLSLLTLNEADVQRIENQERFPVIKKSNDELQVLLQLPENRLAILGGLRGVSTQLNIHKVKPNMKTVTELAQIVSPAEIPDVLMLIDVNKLKPDIHFFNMVIKKYVTWKEDGKAKEVLELLGKHHLTPNIMTWGILALSARSWTDASKLLTEMDALEIIPNKEIMGGFLLNACRGYDPRYILRLLEEHVRRDLRPDSAFIARVEKFQKFSRQAILDAECGREVYPPRLKSIVQTEKFNEYWIKLNLRFDGWVKQVGVLEETTPWKKDYEERIEKLQKRRYEGVKS